jgi:hypothetical protein
MRKAHTQFDPNPITKDATVMLQEKLPYMGPNPQLVTEKMSKRFGVKIGRSPDLHRVHIDV